jgi:hypothetical protein
VVGVEDPLATDEAGGGGAVDADEFAPFACAHVVKRACDPFDVNPLGLLALFIDGLDSFSRAFPIFHPQAIHAFEFSAVMGDEGQIERESLAAELQVIGADFHAGFFKRVTDFRRFDGRIPIEGQQVEWLQKGGHFFPLPLGGVATESTRIQLEYTHHRNGAFLGTVDGQSLNDLWISAHGGNADVGIKEVGHLLKSTTGGRSPCSGRAKLGSTMRMLSKNPSGQVEALTGTKSTPSPKRRIETTLPSNLSSLGILTACERPFVNKVVVIAGIYPSAGDGSMSNRSCR